MPDTVSIVTKNYHIIARNGVTESPSEASCMAITFQVIGTAHESGCDVTTRIMKVKAYVTRVVTGII